MCIRDSAICGMKTEKHIFSEDGERQWDRFGTHNGNAPSGFVNNDDSGVLLQAQAFIKPSLVLSTGTNYGKNITSSNGITLDNNSKNNWLDFVPNLKNYYIVSDKVTSQEGDTKYLPGGTTDIITSGSPTYICLLYTSPSPRDQRGSRMPSSA